MTETLETIVIGAGVIGLAIARALALAGREVIVLEKNHGIGEETSSRNSEVIHAGLYYPAGSLKARFCVEGKERLYDYCAAKGIDHRRSGKILVAIHDEQTPKLQALREFAIANGVRDLEWLSAHAVHELEPAVRAAAGLWSPSTGIIDSHAFMLALRGDVEQAGGSVAVLSRMIGGAPQGDAMRLVCEIDGAETAIGAKTVINAAGLHASKVAHALSGAKPAVPPTRYAKGNYFIYNGKSPFSHLLYPLPEDGGLGIHVTLDLAGRTRFGPDVEWLAGSDPEAIDYSVDPARAATFYRAVRSYWPELPDGALSPAYAGVRPKLCGPGEPAADFEIQTLHEPGGPRLVQLFGIESPGLTASLAIAEHVRDLLG
jgi:L-2-hydroxyglutarate oxidase LhgO